jgi:hypothetical protein
MTSSSHALQEIYNGCKQTRYQFGTTENEHSIKENTNQMTTKWWLH